MAEEKKVSVIIPCYNAVKWLPKCFVSLVSQAIGIEKLELIFVDDASTDQGVTWEMLQEFEAAYPEHILAIHSDENMRQGGARNVGMRYATGEYLAFVDADDFVAEDFLAKAYQRAKECDADIVQFEYYYYTEHLGAIKTDRKIMPEIVRIESVSDRKTFLVRELITYGCWNKLYRRELVQQAGVQYAEHVIYEEPLFVYPLLFYADSFVVMKEPLYYYRQNADGTMRNDMKEWRTLQMHADVSLAVWKFMQNTPFFQTYYEEIKLYFLHSYFYETLYFAKQRGFVVSLEMFHKLEKTVMQEVEDYLESAYEKIIPIQMELYRMIGTNFTEEKLRCFMEENVR